MSFPRLLIFVIIAAFISGCREDSAPTANIRSETDEPAQGFIEVTSPTYSENWHPGTAHTIRWDFDSEIIKVNILLYRKDIEIMTIASGIDNKAFYDWTVPESISYSHHYRVKVIDAVGKKSEDYSDYFYIIAFQ